MIASGRAHYDGTSALPARLDVVGFTSLKAAGQANLSRWRGTFEDLEISEEEEWN